MAIVDLVMPKMGESIMEATILKWHKQPGDHVKMDETVLEIATDKVDTEVPSTAEGVIDQVLYNVNDVVPVGSVIAKIKTNVTEGASGKPQDAVGQEQEYATEALEEKAHSSKKEEYEHEAASHEDCKTKKEKVEIAMSQLSFIRFFHLIYFPSATILFSCIESTSVVSVFFTLLL